MRIRTTAFLLIALALVAGACGDDADQTPEQVTGVIVDIESEGIGRVESFQVKDGDETYDIHIDPDREYGFSLGHLHEHLQTSEPVRVDLQHRDDTLIAVTIEDA